jgi:hypothetical protein
MSESESFEATVGEYRIGDKAIYLTGVRRGEKNEQERIIKLLKAQKVCPCCCFNDDCRWKAAKKELIALIKGETNE